MNLHKRVVQLFDVRISPRSLLVKDIQKSRFICSTDLVPLQRKPHGLYQTINLYTVHATCKRNFIKVSGYNSGIQRYDSQSKSGLYHVTQLFRCPAPGPIHRNH